MKLTNFMNKTNALLLTTVLVSACGAKDSANDGEGREDTSGQTGTNNDGSTSSSSSFVPTLNFTIPNSVAAYGLNLAGESDLTIIERRSQRAQKTIDRINEVLSRLNRDKIQSRGGFTGKGVDGLLSGKVDQLSGDDYAYEAVICYDSKPFMHVKWCEDQSKVVATRDFSVSPMGRKDPTDLVVKVDYEASETKTVEMMLQGNPWRVSNLEQDGENLVEFTSSKIDAEGIFTLSGVNDWYTEAPAEGASFEGDGYIVGKLDTEGMGEFVGYQKADSTNCAEFDESNTEDPGFCKGREVGADSRFTDEERLAAWERLSEIGISSNKDLVVVSMPADLSCELVIDNEGETETEEE